MHTAASCLRRYLSEEERLVRSPWLSPFIHSKWQEQLFAEVMQASQRVNA